MMQARKFNENTIYFVNKKKARQSKIFFFANGDEYSITTDPYIVYTSNIFAILGLRALYFALAAIIHRFAYLKQALAVLLVFIGSKIFLADLLGWDKFPAEWSLTITAVILASGIAYSLWRTARPQH